MKVGKNGCWIEVMNRIPFRRTYLYWGDAENDVGRKILRRRPHMLGFVNRREEWKGIRGWLFSCWVWQCSDVEWLLDLIGEEMWKREDFRGFMKEWIRQLVKLEKQLVL